MITGQSFKKKCISAKTVTALEGKCMVKMQKKETFFLEIGVIKICIRSHVWSTKSRPFDCGLCTICNTITDLNMKELKE